MGLLSLVGGVADMVVGEGEGLGGRRGRGDGADDKGGVFF